MKVNIFRKALLSGALMCVYLNSVAKSTDVRNLEDFDEIEVNNGVSVILQKCSKGENPEAKIEVDGIETSSVTTKIKGEGVLAISTKAKPEKVELGKKVKKQKANVILKYKDLKKIKLKGASSCIVDEEKELKSKELELIADGGAKFEGNISVDGQLKITAKSGAKLKISGKVASSVLECSGTCTLDMSNVDVKIMELNATTGSTVKVKVLNDFKGTINSLAKLFFSGEPKKFELNRGSLAIVKFSDEAGEEDDKKSTSKKKAVKKGK